MRALFSLLSALCSIYSLIIFIRIIFTWFGGGYGRVENIMGRITDPYLNWFRRFSFLRIGLVDISPVAALAVLSLLNRAFFMLANSAVLTIGRILALALQIVWSAVSFLLVVGIIILVLRLIAYLTNQNTFSRFWRTIDTLSQPITFRINRIFFGGRIVRYLTGLLLSTGVLILSAILGAYAVNFLSIILSRMPF